MICFTCENCGRKVRTDDAHSGMKARCPSCRAIVSVPTVNHDFAALAAAVAAKSPAETDGLGQVPPPPPPGSLDGDEIELADTTKDPSAETDILVADLAEPEPTDQGPSPAPAEPAPRPIARRERTRLGMSLRLWILLATAVVIVAAIVAALYLLPSAD